MIVLDISFEKMKQEDSPSLNTLSSSLSSPDVKPVEKYITFQPLAKEKREIKNLQKIGDGCLEDELVYRKTRLCQYYAKGYCVHGKDCRYAHGENELIPQPTKNPNSYTIKS